MRSRLGIVSNCWKHQLDAGIELDRLVESTLEIGLRHIELRQGALGEYESADRVPDVDRLSTLATRFPEATFNLAVELPVIVGTSRFDFDFAHRCAEAAIALSSPAADRMAHLRIVDLSGTEVSSGAEREASIDLLSTLQEILQTRHSWLLSLEHSIQPWADFWGFFVEARKSIDLKLCFDPCNLWLCEDDPPISEIVDSVPQDLISMFHIKQRNSSGVLEDLSVGDVPWPSPLHHLLEKGYVGPILLETAPCADVFEQTERNCCQIEDWLAAG